MKIEVRVPTAQYAYHSVFFDSIEEYQKEYPNYVRAYMEMDKVIEKVKSEKPPFESQDKDRHTI